MAYQTYITDALVCGSRVQNTADKTYLLLTREAGMVYATAKSVREERSKQRFSLQEFSYIRATLIYGKTGWRVTGTEPIQNLYAIQSSRESRTLIRNVIRLLRRLLQGEVPHPELFDEVLEVLTLQDDGNAKKREEVMTIRLLHALGYVAKSSEIADIIESRSLDECARTLAEDVTGARQKIINQALHESQL